jgi:hypothetical protein
MVCQVVVNQLMNLLGSQIPERTIKGEVMKMTSHGIAKHHRIWCNQSLKKGPSGVTAPADHGAHTRAGSRHRAATRQAWIML